MDKALGEHIKWTKVALEIFYTVGNILMEMMTILQV